MHDKFSIFLLKLIHLCQKISRFSYREVSRGRLENIGPPLEGADSTNSQVRRPLYKKDARKKTLLECTMHDEFLNILLKHIHLCQKMSRFSYREVSRAD